MWAYKPVNSPAFSYIFASFRKSMNRDPNTRRASRSLCARRAHSPKAQRPLARAPCAAYPKYMKAALLLLTILASPAHAGVAVSAEAGAEASIPRISLQTSLSPMSGPALGSTFAPSLNASFAAPSAPMPIMAAPAALTANAVPVPLAASAIPAASAPEAPKPAAVLPAAEKGAPSFKTKILGMLKGMANPFGGKKSEEIPPSEAERLDREFTKRDVWSQVAPSARAEIETLRARKLSKADFKEHVRSAARAAMARMQAAAGTNNIGFHYNLHGGQREQYVGKGIHATMGDIALQYSMHGDRNQKVYFFQSMQTELYDLLNESHPQMLLFPSRMGSALNLFNVDAPEILAAKAEGRIRNHGAISMDFHGMGGVPYSAYLAPPIEVFHRTAKKVGLKKLTRDEETLATIRYLEAVVNAGAPYIPR